jgi:hypothetical protein
LGRIVSTEPAAGAELPEEIAFNVADSPAELQLADKDTSIGSVRAYSNVEVEGKAYDRAIELTGRDDTPATASWLIGGNGVELVGAVALDDNTGADQQAVLQILGDSRELYRGGVNLKTPVALPALDVTGVQTITLVVTAVAPPDRYYAVTVSLLDLKLLASYDQIAAIR